MAAVTISSILTPTTGQIMSMHPSGANSETLSAPRRSTYRMRIKDLKDIQLLSTAACVGGTAWLGNKRIRIVGIQPTTASVKTNVDITSDSSMQLVHTQTSNATGASDVSASTSGSERASLGAKHDEERLCEIQQISVENLPTTVGANNITGTVSVESRPNWSNMPAAYSVASIASPNACHTSASEVENAKPCLLQGKSGKCAETHAAYGEVPHSSTRGSTTSVQSANELDRNMNDLELLSTVACKVGDNRRRANFTIVLPSCPPEPAGNTTRFSTRNNDTAARSSCHLGPVSESEIHKLPVPVCEFLDLMLPCSQSNSSPFKMKGNRTMASFTSLKPRSVALVKNSKSPSNCIPEFGPQPTENASEKTTGVGVENDGMHSATSQQQTTYCVRITQPQDLERLQSMAGHGELGWLGNQQVRIVSVASSSPAVNSSIPSSSCSNDDFIPTVVAPQNCSVSSPMMSAGSNSSPSSSPVHLNHSFGVNELLPVASIATGIGTMQNTSFSTQMLSACSSTPLPPVDCHATTNTGTVQNIEPPVDANVCLDARQDDPSPVPSQIGAPGEIHKIRSPTLKCSKLNVPHKPSPAFGMIPPGAKYLGTMSSISSETAAGIRALLKSASATVGCSPSLKLDTSSPAHATEKSSDSLLTAPVGNVTTRL